MKVLKVICFLLSLGYAQTATSQCNDCDAMNSNGDFELRNNNPGSDNDLGISTGEITNWFASHGTADFVDETWNWYYVDGIEDNAAHVCYGSRNNHDHSEGIYTQIDLKGEAGIDYCLQMELATICNTEKHGKLHVYLANNLTATGPNGFTYPTPQTNPFWFEGAQLLDIITLDESTDFEKEGFVNFTIPFTTENDYTQLWVFTEFNYPEVEYSSCGLMIDNVKLTGTKKYISEIQETEEAAKVRKFNAVLTEQLDEKKFFWDFGNGETSEEVSPTVTFEEGLYDVTLKVVNQEGVCDVKTKQIKVGDFETEELCDYQACLETGGVPVISSLDVVLPNGTAETLDSETPGFGFPYCLSVSDAGEYEFEYFVLDLDNWLKQNNFKGEVVLVENNTIEDFCRGEKFAILDTDVFFEKISLGDEKETSHKTEIYLEQDCTLNYIEETETENRSTLANTIIETYPNPTVDVVNIEFEDASEQANILLLDSSGNAIQQKELSDINSGDKTEMTLTDLNPGVYYVRVNVGNQTETKKLIKL